MDPFYNNRGSRPGFFNQPSNSFMNSYYDQNVFNEQASSSLPGPGPRMNFHISDSTMFDQGVGSERIAGPYAGNLSSDQFRYNSYAPSNVPYINQAHNSPPDNYSLNESYKFARNFNQDSIQTNRLNIPINNEEVNYILDGPISPEVNVPAKNNVDKYNQQCEKAYNFSQKDSCYPHETNIEEADNMKEKNNLAVSKDVDDIPDRRMASENIAENEMEVDDNVKNTVSHDVDQNKCAEKAVDLSKSTKLFEKDQMSGVTYTETTTIKKEKIDDNEITEATEAAENEDDYDSDKTIENEPVDKVNKVFKCTECDKVYRCDSSLKKHLNIHAGLYKCRVCNKVWSSKYALMQHEKVHSGEREGNLCTTCGKTFFDSSSLNKHIKSVHAGIKTFSCDRCELSFYARKTLVEHIRVHTGERPFKCKLCPKTYKRISDLNHHIRGHTGETKHVCDVCGKGVRRLSELKVHMNQHRDDMFHVKKSDCVCNSCSKTFKNLQDLNNHIKNHCDHVTQRDYNRDEQDSALIAAAINSELPDDGHNFGKKGTTENIGMPYSDGEVEVEGTSFQAKMQQLYKQAGLKPSTTSRYMNMLNSQMPVSDASFHAYFPLPGDKETCPAQREPGEIRRTESKQIRPVKPVDNWLDKNFSTNVILHKDTSHDVTQHQSLIETFRGKRNNDKSDTTTQQFDREHVNYLNNTHVHNAVTCTAGISGEKQESVATVMDKLVIDNNDTSTIKIGTGISGEKQKSIATVIDKLAEKKSKDLEATVVDDIKIKSEIMDDGEETDDYEIDSHEIGEPEEVHQIDEQEKTESILKKQLQKGKSVKRQNRKQTMKDKPKLKHTKVKKRERKQQPKKLKKAKQKSVGKSSKKESAAPLETSSIKSEKESETDDFPSDKPIIKDGLRVCSECDKTFKSRSAFRKHREMHKGMYTCTECNKSLSSGWSLRQHMQTHTSSDDRTRYPCSVCEKAFCDKSSLNKHIKSVHMGYRPFKCTECDHTFSERKTMAEHLRTHTGERPFLCTYCPKTFKRVSELNHHIRWHTGETKHTCDTCGRGFRRLSELLRHMTLHTEEKPYQCSICGKEFRNFSVLREHTLRHLGQSKYSCERCGRKYYKKTHLTRHLRSDRDCTKCKYCLVTMEDPLERAQHEATHEGELKYSCTVCGKRFRGRGPLNKHRRIHSQDRSYVCDVCGATFIQSNHLKQHYRTHTGEKPFSCLVCGKAFAQSGTLYSHMKTHLPDAQMTKVPIGYQYGASESSEENEIKDLDVIKHAVNMIETKVV